MLKRRGRPPHPDILTPRQWEVLNYIRQGLSDQEIAERIDVSLDGAKYHVSEILSKLGVATREEAAAWKPEAPRRLPVWQRAFAVAAMLAALAALAGVGVLAFGVVSNSEAQEGKYVSRDAALIIAGAYYPRANGPCPPPLAMGEGCERGTVSVAWLQPGEATAEIGDATGAPSENEGAWKVSTLYFVDRGGPYPPTYTTSCTQYSVYVPDRQLPTPITRTSQVALPCGLWTATRDQQMSEIGTWISWRSGSPAPKVLLADDVNAANAMEEAGLSTPRPFPSFSDVPGSDTKLGPQILLVHVQSALPKRDPQVTEQWDEHPDISCQDLYFGLGEIQLFEPNDPTAPKTTNWPVIDESAPSNDC
jgi:DNA-binding CsgD family transcriptional regulator